MTTYYAYKNDELAYSVEANLNRIRSLIYADLTGRSKKTDKWIITRKRIEFKVSYAYLKKYVVGTLNRDEDKNVYFRRFGKSGKEYRVNWNGTLEEVGTYRRILRK